jgi:hypothetical protein
MAGRTVARWGSLVAGLVAASVLVTACAGTGYNYVKSSDFHTYFKVPDHWKLYDEKEVVDATATDLSEEQRDFVVENSWRTMFDASTKPSLAHVLSYRAKSPTGYAVVAPLSSQDSLSANDDFLINYFVDVNTALNEQRLTTIKGEPVNLDGGFHGIHLVAKLVVSDTDAATVHEGPAIVFDQVVMIDQQHKHIYAVILACSAQCYDDNQEKIDSVIASWTVKDA